MRVTEQPAKTAQAATMLWSLQPRHTSIGAPTVAHIRQTSSTQMTNLSTKETVTYTWCNRRAQLFRNPATRFQKSESLFCSPSPRVSRWCLSLKSNRPASSTRSKVLCLNSNFSMEKWFRARAIWSQKLESMVTLRSTVVIVTRISLLMVSSRIIQ